MLASLFKTKKEKTRWQRFLDWWVIDPRNSRYLGYWDLATVLALFFVALVTPFGVLACASRAGARAHAPGRPPGRPPGSPFHPCGAARAHFGPGRPLARGR